MKATTVKNKTYTKAIGRRKTAAASVRLVIGNKDKTVTINGKSLTEYFPTEELRALISQVLHHPSAPGQVGVSVMVRGGGIHAQAEAVRHGIARALIAYDKELRLPIKKDKLLTRDSRMKERRKFGLKKARKAPQWSKR